ncbi:translocator protein [Patella vulgata]|uniref:translocator protein n=1 Tax=Patella vulgata TaxID=6465 RepID=UPI0024A89B41|nr:translocator protein [Patella vulgata]
MAEYLRPACAIILPNLGGFAGLFVTRSSNSRNWYQNLNKPSWRPSGGVIGPIWTYLYCTMGYASYLVWRDGGGFDGRARLPLAVFGAQLALNWAWTPIFFGAKKLDLATIDIVALWGSIVATIVTFKPINKTASYLLLPYLGWISVVSCINYYIWMNNKNRQD